MTCHFKLLPFWKRLVGMTANVKRLCDVAVLDGTNAQYTAEAQ